MATQPKTAKEVLKEFGKIEHKINTLPVTNDNLETYADEIENFREKQRNLLHKFIKGLHPGTSIL